MDCFSPYAMANNVFTRSQFYRLQTIPYLIFFFMAMIQFFFFQRTTAGLSAAAIGKTLVSSSVID